MNTNLLDLDNDIFNIIGDHVKQDNDYRIEKEKDFANTYNHINYLRENKKLKSMK